MTEPDLARVLAHLVSAVEAHAVMLKDLLYAERTGMRLSSLTVADYEGQLKVLDQECQHFRTLIGKWWALLEGDRPN